jgi:flagellar assembly factor FliW
MPLADTEQFGPLDYQEDAALLFPRGLPGFEQRHRFVLVKQPDLAPLVHLQSLESAELCFVAIPVQVIDQDYHPQLLPEDADLLGVEQLDSTHSLLLALLAVSCDGHVTANLLAPIVVNLATRTALQAVRGDSQYSHQYVLSGSHFVADQDGGQPSCS